jgi:hypothetical protein
MDIADDKAQHESAEPAPVKIEETMKIGIIYCQIYRAYVISPSEPFDGATAYIHSAAREPTTELRYTSCGSLRE